MANYNHTPKKEKNPVPGTTVEVYNNDINKALRRLKKVLADDGIFQDLRNREYFQSKGAKRRIAKAAAIRRYKKSLRDQSN